MKRYYLPLLIFLLCAASLVQAQQVVTGTVKDDLGEPLPGVIIKEKGTSAKAVSDVQGNFKITVTGSKPVLVFSYISFSTQEIAVGSKRTIDISLKKDISQLQEVVVVGFGTQKKVNLSGAVDQIDTKAIAARPISNAAQGLQGLIPNLNIDFGSGEPGAAAAINIRGIGSINGASPLILIDGVPSDATEMNRLTPQDIETISVIKDASAAAIYGARAAYGVILITTKSGTSEGLSVNYSTNTSFNKPTVLPDKITDPYIFSRLLELSTDNTPWDNVNYSDQFYAYARQRSDDPSTPGVRIDPSSKIPQWEYMGNRDWSRYFLSDKTVSTDHALSVSGRGSKAQYYLSGSYNRQDGMLKIADDYFDRYGLRSKINYSIRPWLSLGNNSYLTVTSRVRPTNYSIPAIYDIFPTSWDKNPDGTWANSSAGIIGAQLTEGGFTKNKYMSLQTQFNGEASVMKDILKLNADFTYRRGAANNNAAQTSYKIGYGPDDVRQTGDSYARKSTAFENYTVLNTYATLNKKFGQSNFTAVAGYNQEYYHIERDSTQRNNLISPAYPSLGLASGNITVGARNNEWAVRGLFYRLNYILKDKYIIEFNGRYDGSSRFPKDKRYGFFPSASAAWRIDQEPFMKPMAAVVSNFKLRGSYGTLGNQASGDYGYIPTMKSGNSGYLIGGELPVTIATPILVSENYTWEEVSTLNGGIDLGLFNNRLNLTLDVYQRRTTGMFSPGSDLPDVLGAAEPEENAADLKNNGWELSLTYQNGFQVGSSPLSFSARFLLSDSRSYITKFANPNLNLQQYYKGMELGEIWGLKSDGLFQTQEEIAALDEKSIIPWDALAIVPGWPKYKDLDNNKAIETGFTLSDPKDLSVIGNSSPRYRFGLDLNASWKGFDIRAFFQGVGKRDYYPLDYLYWGFYQQPYAGGYAHLLDFYRPVTDNEIQMAGHSQAYINAGLASQNLNARYPILQAWLADINLGTRTGEAKGLAIPQTGYMLNAAYLRFKNLTIGYTLPSRITSKWGLTNVRIYASGENIYEWSKLKKFYDPESININTNLNPSRNTNTSGNGYAYPWQRRYAIGLNANF